MLENYVICAEIYANARVRNVTMGGDYGVYNDYNDD